jgi:glycosyltransferase involved in cell wall biosynthesis
MNITIVRSRGIDQSVHKVAKALSKNGHNVKLLIWDRQNTLKCSHVDYAISRFTLEAPYDRLSVVFYLPIWWAFEFLFLLRNDSDVIHACDFDTLIPALLIRYFKKVKICYTIYDFYADTVLIKIPSAFRKFVASLEKFSIVFVDVIFLVDESRLKQIKGSKISKVVYINNSPPDCLGSGFGQIEHTEVLRIFYAGVINEYRGLEYIINAVRELNNVNLIIAGKGPDEDLLKREIRTARDAVQFVGYLPYEKVLEKEMDSDILFAFYDCALPAHKYASPNKLFEAMMCKKPIIVSDGSTMADIVRRVDCGIVVPYGDIEAIKAAILKLQNDPKLRQKLGENGRKAYDDEFSWKIMEHRLIDAYAKLGMDTTLRSLRESA